MKEHPFISSYCSSLIYENKTLIFWGTIKTKCYLSVINISKVIIVIFFSIFFTLLCLFIVVKHNLFYL